ncbi:MAG: glycosyltransferase family 2 protein [Verrucomicrobiales bacterium]|nr:glycosyltransferase family 2 protein [Verrucomicrobiales bacterium]
MRLGPEVCLVLPVLNEERQLSFSVRRTREVLDRMSHWQWDLVVVDNGSTDRTWDIARDLERRGWARVMRLEQRGRGRALRAAWLSSEADFLAYMDVDLSTDLRHLGDLLEPLALGLADVTVGSRLMRRAEVRRSWIRGVLSRNYNRLARRLTGSGIVDHQCGFKAMTRGAARALLPQVENNHWFFDTELLILAQRKGWRIREFPVVWTEDEDSRVRLMGTILEEFCGLWRLRTRRRFRSSTAPDPSGHDLGNGRRPP